MPPKQRITREMILERAFDMFCREGIEAVNARSVAKALNCSTQPIFSYYSGMQELKDSLNVKAQEMFAEQVLATPMSETWLEDVCSAYVCFAVERPYVFTYLFGGIAEKKEDPAYFALHDALVEYIANTEGCDMARADALYADISVYTHGMAMMNVLTGRPCDEVVKTRISGVWQALRAKA